MGAKIIVVACNTATTNAITYLRKNYPIPFVVFEPAIKPASFLTNSNSIGILATKGTLSSDLFHETCKKFAKNKTVIEQEGNGIVELIESGDLHSLEMTNLLKRYLSPMIKKNVDCIVLGCTHYHFLIPIIQKIIPKKIKIIDSGKAIALQTKNILKKNLMANSTTNNVYNRFYTNGKIKTIAELMNWNKSKIELLRN